MCYSFCIICMGITVLVITMWLAGSCKVKKVHWTRVKTLPCSTVEGGWDWACIPSFWHSPLQKDVATNDKCNHTHWQQIINHTYTLLVVDIWSCPVNNQLLTKSLLSTEACSGFICLLNSMDHNRMWITELEMSISNIDTEDHHSQIDEHYWA